MTKRHAVLVAPSGRVFSTLVPAIVWHERQLLLPYWKAGHTQILRQSNSSFVLKDSDGPLRVGKFVVSSQGQLQVRVSAALPPWFSEVVTVSESGRFVAARTERGKHSVLWRDNSVWRTLGGDFDVNDGLPTIVFSNDDRFLCACFLRQKGVNSNSSRLVLYRNHQHRVARITNLDSWDEFYTAIAFDHGWYVTMGGDDAETTYTLRPRSGRKLELVPYGSGAAVYPVLQQGIALHHQYEKILTFKNRVVGQVPPVGEGSMYSAVYYCPGVGSISLQYEAKYLWVNNTAFPLPALIAEGQLYLI